MTFPRTNFPPVRACLFDMDGLLIDTEDIYTICHNILLTSYSAQPMTWTIKAQLQGRPTGEANDILLAWANLQHVSRDEYASKLSVIQAEHFPTTAPLPGVEKLLRDLTATQNGPKERKVHIALATSSYLGSFKVKTDHLTELFSTFEPERRVLGDDLRIPKGRGKPSPDIYLLALKVINDSLGEGEEKISPDECLVFEDSVPGIEAGRRAGMRVVWVPHAGLAAEYHGREAQVLAGRGEGGDKDAHQLGVVGDGWGEQLGSLENFPYAKYGIVTVE